MFKIMRSKLSPLPGFFLATLPMEQHFFTLWSAAD
jgi:hypothetical protein